MIAGRQLADTLETEPVLQAFGDCTSLESVAISDMLYTVGDNAFSGVTATVYYSENANVSVVGCDYGGALTWICIDTGPFSLDASMFAVDTSDAVYTGSAITKAVSADGLAEGTDYEVVYVNNTAVGTAGIVIVGRGDYTGTLSYSFRIAAAPPSSQSIKAAKSKVKVKAGKKKAVKVTGAKTSLQKKLAKKAKKNLKVTVKGKKVVIKAKTGASKGTYKVKVRAKASSAYEASAWRTIAVKVK